MASASPEESLHFADPSARVLVSGIPTSTLGIFLLVGRENDGGFVSGTCFYLQRPSGRYVITANHVVRDAESIAVRVGQAWTNLKIVRQDRSTDLAALRADDDLTAAPLQLRPNSARIGEQVDIFGYPIPDVLGISAITHVYGKVENYDANPGGISGFWISAPAGPGNSGGPVLDSTGRVIGIIAYARTDGSMAFAVHGFYILKLLGEEMP
jgi:S1-C subfamily serine protease